MQSSEKKVLPICWTLGTGWTVCKCWSVRTVWQLLFSKLLSQQQKKQYWKLGTWGTRMFSFTFGFVQMHSILNANQLAENIKRQRATKSKSARAIIVIVSAKGSHQKKNGYFTVRLTVRVDPPPPYGQLFCDFFWGAHLTLVYDYTWVETNFDQKKFFDPLFDPYKDFGWVTMSISSSNNRDNGTKNAMMWSALIMHF